MEVQVNENMSETDKDSAISSISKIAIDRELAQSMLLGQTDYLIESREDLQRFFMMRHNWMHYLVCQNFNLPFSDDFSLSDYLELSEIQNSDCIRNHKYWDLIHNQTPDIIKLDGNGTILLIDIAVRSSEDHAKRDKQAKYLTMQIAFQDCGYSCEIIPIVFDSAARINQVDYVIDHLNALKLNKTQDFKNYRSMILKILDTAKEIEKNSRQRDPIGFQNWLKFGQDQEHIDYRVGLIEDDVITMARSSEYNPFGKSDIRSVLSDRRLNNLSLQPEDEDFLRKCSDTIFNSFMDTFNKDVMPILDMKARIPEAVKAYDSKMRDLSSLSKKFRKTRKCFIFPYCTDVEAYGRKPDLGQGLLDLIGDIQGNDHHADLLRSLRRRVSEMRRLDKQDYSEFCGTLPVRANSQIDRSNTGCISIPMDRATKAWHQSEGPGRKNLIKTGYLSQNPTIVNLAHDAVVSDKEKKTAVIDWDTDLTDLEEFIRDLNTLGSDSSAIKVDHTSDFEKFPAMDVMVDEISSTLSRSMAIKWCSFVQMISQEIARNSTRKRKGSKYCVSLCDDKRYAVMLAPGFRITSSNKPIWFKIFSNSPRPTDGGLFPDIRDHGTCWSTEWRSIDIFQLESFIRVRDSLAMCLLSYSESTNPGIDDSSHLKNVFMETDSAAIMACIMVSHNRSTSTVIQSARYMALRMLSVHPDPTSLLMKDFNVPIRNQVLLLLIRRMLRFISKMSEYKVRDLQNRMKTGFEKNTGDVVDLDVDQPDDLPHIFTEGKGQSYSGLLCEIYFCMLFNKNQDEPSNAALSILSKIVEEESKLDNEDLPEGFETGLLDDDTCIKIAHSGFKSHFFSAHAVAIGSKLQSIHHHNKKPMGSAFLEVIHENKFIKTLDKYATFKASTTDIKRDIDLRGVDPFNCIEDCMDIDMSGEERDIESLVNEFDLSDKEHRVLVKRYRGIQLNANERFVNNGILQKINDKNKPLRSLANRTKCVVNVVKLLAENEDVVTNVEFLRKHIKSIEAQIQIFKKNQIGGVREIEILTMDMRILLEYVERVPTCISKYDEREMISAKQRKGEIIKSNLMKMLGESSGRPLLNLNSCRDMSKWSQAFMPIIFFYTVLPYKDISYDYVLTNLAAQIKMSNKRLELPSKLVELWLKNPDEKHESSAMQALKAKFLSQDRSCMDCTYLNKSGMGQGLEQTGSTVLHLCQLSLRDRVWSMVVEKLKAHCKTKGYNIDLWYRHFDAVSSDDKTTYKLFSPKFPDCLISLMLFKKVEAFTEALFCMQDSERKSVELVNLAEFNSEFTMRYNQYSPIIKFAHKSVLIPDTRSPLRAISQLYGSVRELRANGASSLLCRYAHYLNKDFLESVFHTKKGLINDPSYIFNCHRKYCPADLGVYPIFQPELMDMAGLEYHNYLVLQNPSPNQPIKMLIRYLYQSSENYMATDYASVERDILADVLPRRVHIEISVGMSANLIRARESCPVSKTSLENSLDPETGDLRIIDLVGPSRTNRVAILKAASLLYTLGAKDSFKNTNGALYYARIGAMATGSCFFLRNSDSDSIDKGFTTGSRFYDLVQDLKKKSISYRDMQSADRMLCHYQIYDKCRSAASIEKFSRRRPGFRLLKSRKMKTYSKSVILKNPLSDLLHYQWGPRHKEMVINSYERDWEILKRRLPFLRDSEGETLKAMNVKSTGINLYKLLVELVKTTTEKNEYSKWLLLGPSTSDMLSTAFCLRHTNSFGGLIGDDPDYTVYKSRREDSREISAFRYSVNCLILDLNLDQSENKTHSLNRFRSYVRGLRINGLSLIDKVSTLGRSGYLEVQDMKRLLLSQMILESSESEIQETLYKLNHSYLVWIIEQENTSGKWEGPFDVMIKSGRSTLRMKGHSDMRGLSFEYLSESWDPFQFHSMLDSLVKIWYPKGLRSFKMHEIRERCIQIYKPDAGMLLLQSSDMMVPELRKLDPAKELIPIKYGTGWRSSDYFFDYRQIELSIDNVIRVSTLTRMGRRVRFTGIYNGMIPLHPSEVADVEKYHGPYRSNLVSILNKAGFQTNNRDIGKLDYQDVNDLISVSKKVILADLGMMGELSNISRLYGVDREYTAKDDDMKQMEESVMYDKLLDELSNEQLRTDSFFSELEIGGPDEDEFFSDIDLSKAMEIISIAGAPMEFNLEEMNIAFEDEMLMGAIEPSPKIKPSITVNQPPVSWAVMGQLFEKCIREQYLSILQRDTNQSTWSSSLGTALTIRPDNDIMTELIKMLLIKYCLENIRVMPQEIRSKFREGSIKMKDLRKFKPNIINVNSIVDEINSDF